MNHSCPPVVVASQYSQQLLPYDRIFKILSCTIMSILSVPVTLINLLVIWTVIKNPSLQTPSFILICSLALTDFGSGFITFPINAYWRILEFTNESANICSTFDIGFAISFTLLSASELTVSALSVDRYLAIRLSSRYRQQVTNLRAVKVVIALWCIAVTWGVSSVYLTPIVLHTTVVVVGIITFGGMFVCYTLFFKILFDQESKSQALRLVRTSAKNIQLPNSAPSKSSWIVDEKQPTRSPPLPNKKQANLPTRGNFPFQTSMKVLPFQQNGSPRIVHRENQNGTENDMGWPQLDIVKDTRKASEMFELEFEESHVRIRGSSCGCGKNTRCDRAEHSTSMVSAVSVAAPPTEDIIPNNSTANKGEQEHTLCPLSIELCIANAEDDCALERPKTKYRKNILNNCYARDGQTCLKKIKDQKSKRKKITNLLKARKRILRPRSGTPARLLKYRHTIITLLWVVAMLILCYAPYFFLSFVVAFIGMTNEIAVAWSIAITFMCINSFINPIIYLWRLNGLRKACLKTLKRARC